MPDNATPERVKIMKAYGAEVYLTPASLRMQKELLMKQTAWQVKFRMALFRCSLKMMQIRDAHRGTTAVEIMESFDGKL